MGWPAHFLNHGVHIGGRQVVPGSIPEAVPTLAGDGFTVNQVLSSGISVVPPSVLTLVDLEGGVAPTATLQIYGYYPAETDLLSAWQFVKEVEIDKSFEPFVVQAGLGAQRLHVIVTAVTGAPTSVRLGFRAISSPLQREVSDTEDPLALRLVKVSDSAVAEGNNSITGSQNIILLKRIKVVTSSVRWTLTLYSKDDYTSDPFIAMANRVGAWEVHLDIPYEDKDETSEFHYNFTDHKGSNTHDIEVWGVKME